jgi:hypothetical protein
LLFERAPVGYWIHDGRQVRGYAFTTPSRLGLRIGPSVALDSAVVETLLQGILADGPHRTIVLGVPAPNRAAVRLLESQDFRRTPSVRRMVRGRLRAGGHPEHIFGIGNGATG